MFFMIRIRWNLEAIVKGAIYDDSTSDNSSEGADSYVSNGNFKNANEDTREGTDMGIEERSEDEEFGIERNRQEDTRTNESCFEF